VIACHLLSPRVAAVLGVDSWTVAFWAKPTSTKGIQDISLTAVDEEGHVCFNINGNKAGIGPLDEYWAESAVNRSQTGDFHYPYVQLPSAAERRNDWVFFALSAGYFQEELEAGVSTTRSHFTFLVDDEHGTRKEYNQDAIARYGCSSMKKIIVTGEEFELSPLRVAERSLSVGRLQLLRLTSRPVVAGLRGPLLPRAARLQPMELPRTPYPLGTMAMSPPLVLQNRGEPTAIDDAESGYCSEGTVFQRLQMGLARTEGKKCSFPFTCDLESSPAAVDKLCQKTTDRPHTNFLGREPLMYKDTSLFAEFPWILEHGEVVRNGASFVPADEFIDTHTKTITCLFSFFTISTQIATVVQVDFDLTRARVEVGVSYLQVRVMSWEDYSEWLGWTIAAMVCIVIFGIQAVPAAIQEFKGFFFMIRCQVAPDQAINPTTPAGADLPSPLRNTTPSLSPMRASASRVLGFGRAPKAIPTSYNADTSQPDLLDVVLSLGLTAFLIYAIVLANHKIRYAPDVFGTMAEIDWSDDGKVFSQKVSEFLFQLGEAMDLTQQEELLLTWVFWLLIICAIRVIVFMGIHPHIAGVYATFKTVGRELINFMFSFGIIFMFLAFIAHVRFGYKYDAFRTIEQSMITQFAILIGDDTPDYNNDPLLTLYVVSYVFICTMALLNFLLAIVVNGYTKVSEQALENTVVVSLGADMGTAFMDVYRWSRHKSWPTKRQLLNIITEDYKAVLKVEDAEKTPITACDLHSALERYGVCVPISDIQELFQYYGRLKCLVYEEGADKTPYHRRSLTH